MDELGLAVARVVVSLLVPGGAAITVAVDDSVFRRSGRRVFGVGGSMTGRPGAEQAQLRDLLRHVRDRGGAAVLLAAGLPAGAGRLHVPGKGRAARKPRRQAAPASTVSAAVALVTGLAGAFPGRRVDVVADAHYHGPALRDCARR